MYEGDIALMWEQSEENRQLKAENLMLRQVIRLCWFCWCVTLVGMLYAVQFMP